MRKIDKIIIHCSATKEGQHVTVATIDKWHKERKFNEIGYHYVIYLDGSVHPGRDISKVGAHCDGYNTTSIGICYIGGLDISGNPKDTRTAPQRQALRDLVEKLKKEYPDATVHGHREFANKACPCFDVHLEFKLKTGAYAMRPLQNHKKKKNLK
jgi:N-acetylmuramoyl-L-alanine amidase